VPNFLFSCATCSKCAIKLYWYLAKTQSDGLF
jgi:hypothetical protein